MHCKLPLLKVQTDILRDMGAFLVASQMLFSVIWLLWISTALSEHAKDYDISYHRNFGYLPNDVCGENQDDRIIGGTKARMGQFPWLVRLGYIMGNCTDKAVYRCGGALITNRHVITAGHCIAKLPLDLCMSSKEFEQYELVVIRLGEHDVRQNPDCELKICADPVQDLEIERLIPHPDYNHPFLRNDIGLIKLARPANFTAWVTPLCLIYGKYVYEEYVNQMAVAAGWGLIDIVTGELGKVLEYINIPIVPIENCIKNYGHRVNVSKFHQICAGGLKGKDTCRGDSGGPLVIVGDTEFGPKYKLLGIVSFGFKKCGARRVPGIYTNILFYINWLMDNL